MAKEKKARQGRQSSFQAQNAVNQVAVSKKLCSKTKIKVKKKVPLKKTQFFTTVPKQEESSKTMEEPPTKEDERQKNDNNVRTNENGASKKKRSDETLSAKKIEQLIICEYKDPSSPTFGKMASTIITVALKKHPTLIDGVLDKRVHQILEEQSTTYSRMRLTKQNKSFFGTSFYSNPPHHTTDGMFTSKT